MNNPSVSSLTLCSLFGSLSTPPSPFLHILQRPSSGPTFWLKFLESSSPQLNPQLLNCKSSEPSQSLFRYQRSSTVLTFIEVRNSDSPTKPESLEKWEACFKFLLPLHISLSSDSTKQLCNEQTFII